MYNTLVGKKKRKKLKEWTSDERKIYFPYLLRKHNDITYIEYLRSKRIELNIIVDAVGAQMFWRWLSRKILSTFPRRSYNRAVHIPKYVFTPTMQEFQNRVIQKTETVTEDRRKEIQFELARTGPEFIIVDEKEDKIKQDLLDNILKSPAIRKIDSSLKDIMEKID